MKTVAWLVILLLVSTTAWGYFHGDALEQQLVILRDERTAIVRERDSLAHRQPRLDTIYQTKVVTRIRVMATTDTLLARDTTPVPRDTVRLLITAEREACDAVVTSCEAQKANLTALGDALRRENLNLGHQVALERKRRPGLFSGILTKVAWAGAGFVVGAVVR